MTGGAPTPLPSAVATMLNRAESIARKRPLVTMDAHDEALAEMKALLDGDPASSGATAAFRALEREKPLKLLTVCVDAETAIWTEDAVTATKLVAKPSNLLLELVMAARAGDWEKVGVLVHGALNPAGSSALRP